MGQISKDRPLVEKINHLLMTYLKRPDQMWRLTWLLYLAKDIDFDIVDRPLSITLKNTLSRIGTSHAAPIVARLWATSVLNPVVRVSGGQIEKYHEQGYLQSGQLLLGGSKHG